ncbi:uncharacterized protein JN550_013538 [Neoarthrinium moseri]|uniref:uncharacterized protein n=1 Tax=Neoarthrinium moseri TaxID=1658444 RepID=UPI001FDD8F5D|nr:uncharacterized protein JN550_013538 [Neoarthrinium moseri]KAI1856972.1 hypothetical protein JN550_013538 [Neoarthrinium moseri]
MQLDGAKCRETTATDSTLRQRSVDRAGWVCVWCLVGMPCLQINFAWISRPLGLWASGSLGGGTMAQVLIRIEPPALRVMGWMMVPLRIAHARTAVCSPVQSSPDLLYRVTGTIIESQQRLTRPRRSQRPHVHSSSMSETTYGSAPKSKARGGHCKRFWWVYLLVLIVIIVIVVPCIILVAVPKMAQQKVDAAHLSIEGITISQSETNSLNMAINSTITTDGSAHAKIAAFSGTMWLLDHDPPLAFATVDFPEVSSDALVTVNTSQHLPIEHMEELTLFNQYLLAKETVNVRVQGDTTIRVSGIARDYPITFSKDVEIVGFNNFAGMKVDNTSVSLSTTKNFNATATIPNPTIWTIDVGNASFYTFFNGANIGNSNITNMVLYPGDNVFPIQGDIQQLPVLKALEGKPYCENGGILPFQISGHTVVNNGQPIPWLADALAASNQSVTIDIGSAVKPLGVQVSCRSSNTTS